MSRFDDAIETVLAHEGGYVNSPDDPGGETKYGISKRNYPDLDIKGLSVDEAKVIYRRDYWRFDQIEDQKVATKVFDLCVNCGMKTGIKMLQRAVGACGHLVVVDGILGPMTINAANAIPPDELLNTLKQEAVEHYYRIVSKNNRLNIFLDGWLKRARS